MTRIGAALACCAFEAGCTSYGVYSDSWAEKKTVKSGACPDLNGEYLALGETFNESHGQQTQSYPVELAMTLSEKVDYSIPGAISLEKVGLQLEGDVLRVTATLIDGGELRFERPVGGCEDSMLVVDTDWHSSITEEESSVAFGTTLGMVHFFERISWRLARAEDGSLLMRKTEGGSLMLWWFPVLPGWDTVWIRFPPYVPTAKAASAPHPAGFGPVPREERRPGDR